MRTIWDSFAKSRCWSLARRERVRRWLKEIGEGVVYKVGGIRGVVEGASDYFLVGWKSDVEVLDIAKPSSSYLRSGHKSDL